MEYPQDAAAWAAAIQQGLGLAPEEGRRQLAEGTFDHPALERWLRETYAEGFSPDFVPALVRNLRGLVRWVYGDGVEPYWPGSDGGQTPTE
jgi:hypothetical protein